MKLLRDGWRRLSRRLFGDNQLDPVNRERAAWFDARYTIVAHRTMSGNARYMVGDRQNRVCRYCGKGKPEATFRKEAHAFPESIGNKWLISFDECDACNDLFSMRLEDDFGKFTGPMRTMGRIRGKGIPKFKSVDGMFRVEVDTAGLLRMSMREDDPRLELDEENKRITLHFTRQPYVPMGVFKCLVKMAVAVMPESDLPRCAHLMKWLREDKHSYESFPYRPLKAFVQFTPGPLPNDVITYYLLRRKDGVEDTFFMQFVLQFSNIIFQIGLPFPEEDRPILSGSRNVNLAYFGNPWLGEHEERYGRVACYPLDLTSPEVKAKEPLPLAMRYAEAHDAKVQTPKNEQG